MKDLDALLDQALKQAFMDGYKQGFRDGYDASYAEQLEQPEAKQSGTVSVTTSIPFAYVCENATGHRYFRWKKPASTYKPIPLYTHPFKEETE